MKLQFLILLFPFLAMQAKAQDSYSAPLLTFKAGIDVLTSYGIDYRSYNESKAAFFQPGIHGGILIKDWFYIGVLGSNYCCFKYKDAYSFERKILAAEVGIPVKKFMLGITLGSENYNAPQKGSLLAEYKFESTLIGLFMEYRIMEHLSFPVRIAYTNDNKVNGYGAYWHFSLGISGIIVVK